MHEAKEGQQRPTRSKGRGRQKGPIANEGCDGSKDQAGKNRAAAQNFEPPDGQPPPNGAPQASTGPINSAAKLCLVAGHRRVRANVRTRAPGGSPCRFGATSWREAGLARQGHLAAQPLAPVVRSRTLAELFRRQHRDQPLWVLALLPTCRWLATSHSRRTLATCNGNPWAFNVPPPPPFLPPRNKFAHGFVVLTKEGERSG